MAEWLPPHSRDEDLAAVEAMADVAVFTEDDLIDIHGYIRMAENAGLLIGAVALFVAGFLAGLGYGH